jgi:hypothetical protein
VGWDNSTGREVYMWLVRGEAARVVQLAAKLTDAPSGETANVLPDVPEGAGYTIEIVARDGGEQATARPSLWDRSRRARQALQLLPRSRNAARRRTAPSPTARPR